ncbi:MAG: BamA/TamA family outer membrane protein [Deltaproteobacteria bacterium]|nr:BamA/TamA family outer membrane protein [Deltaproteobacteria bacterium]
MTKGNAALAAILLGFLALMPRAFAVDKQIGRIEYIGLKNIQPRDLESLIPFSPGDVYRENLREVMRKIVVDYYAKRGFHRAEVDVKPEPLPDKNLAVFVRVEEGPPCLIRSFTIEDPPGFKSKHIFERFKSRMNSVAGVSPGDRYDEEWLSDRLRDLREWLVDQDYILVNTDRVTLDFNEDRTAVDVISAVSYGERVSFGFQGNTVFTKGEFNEFITQLRATGLGRDYVAVIQRKFMDEYRNRAYNGIRVDPRIAEKENTKHVTFHILEGARARLRELKWEGMSPENAAAARAVFETGVSRYVQRGYYVDRDVDKGIDLVTEDLKSKGFLSAKLVAKTIQQMKSKTKEFDDFSVAIQISQGEQTIVGRIEIEGARHLSPEAVRAILRMNEGEPFNPFALEEGIQKLRARYVSDGFLNFTIITPDNAIVSFSSNNRLANVKFEIQEGARARVDAIRIVGLDLTKPYVVEREVAFASGDWWLSDKIVETENNLRKLGLFSEVKIRAEPSSKGKDYRIAVVELKETPPGAFEAGPGFRSDLGVRAFSRVSYNNFLGKNWIGTLGAETNRRVNEQYRFTEYKVDSAVIEPRFFGTRTLYSAGISTSKERFPPNFNASSTRFTTGFERKFFTDSVTAKLYYKLERIRQFDVFVLDEFGQVAKSDIDNQQLLIGSLNPALVYDTRDSPFTTTRGQVSSLSLEYADPAFSGETPESANATGYYRWTGGTHLYVPLTKDIVWSNVLTGGFERSNIQGRPIPLIKLFRLGGYASIRGYTEDSINVDAISIKGTLTYLNLRTQFDLPLAGELKFAPFLDAGNLYIDNFGIRPFLRVGSGAGLHYLTPIGPVNLDYGIKLNPRKDDPPTQIHFSVGFI